MIYEYAIDPNIIIYWCKSDNYRYIYDSFGYGSCRMVTRYPEKWWDITWQLYDRKKDLNETKFVELMKRLKEAMVKRNSAEYKDSEGWVENIIIENKRIKIYTVIADREIKEYDNILCGKIDEVYDSILWSKERTAVVKRQCAEMAECVSCLLKSSYDIVFVDPYFKPWLRRYNNTFCEYIKAIMRNRPCGNPRRIEINVKLCDGGINYYVNKMKKELVNIKQKKKIKIKLKILEEIEGKDRLHNRYILTENGGVEFGIGLDEGRKGETDDVSVLGRENYFKRWNQYADNRNEFKCIAEIEI